MPSFVQTMRTANGLKFTYMETQRRDNVQISAANAPLPPELFYLRFLLCSYLFSLVSGAFGAPFAPSTAKTKRALTNIKPYNDGHLAKQFMKRKKPLLAFNFYECLLERFLPLRQFATVGCRREINQKPQEALSACSRRRTQFQVRKEPSALWAAWRDGAPGPNRYLAGDGPRSVLKRWRELK